MLRHVIDSVRERLVAAGVTAPLLIGKQHLHQHGDGAARFVIIPANDTFGAGTTQDFNGLGGRAAQRPLVTRAAGAEVHIWGVPSDPKADTAPLDAIEATENLLHAFVRELRNVTRGQRSSISGSWNNEIKDLAYGAEYVLQVSVDVPVTEIAKPALPAGTTVTTTVHMGDKSEEI